MFIKSVLLAALAAASIAAPVDHDVRSCTEGLYNCLDGKTFQQCVSGGVWSVVMPVAAGTACHIGISANPWLTTGADKSDPTIIGPLVSATTSSTFSLAASTISLASADVPSSVYAAPQTASTSVTVPSSTPSADHVSSSNDPDPNPIGNDTDNGGFAPMVKWPTFEHMLAANTIGECDPSWGVANNSPEETQQLIEAIKSNAGTIDPRFILSIVMQESSGCVRVPTTNNGVRNPGVMQDSNGSHSCNDAAVVQNPCPVEQINGMISDGISGGDNNYSKALKTAQADGYEDSYAYAIAARIYNSGSVDVKNLNKGFGSDSGYVSRIMGRLSNL